MRHFKLCLCFFMLWFSAAYGWDQINFSVSQPAGLPYFVGVPEINVDTEEFSTLILKIKSTQSGTARLFWSCSLDQRINEPKSLGFYLDKSSGFKEYVFNVGAQNPYWMGYVNQIIVLPENNAAIEIASAQAISGNFLTNCQSGWREFWGPFSRKTIGSTINVVKSPTIFGQSVYLLTYWIIFLLIIYFITQGYLAEKAWSLTLWESVGKKVVVATIIIWGLLEISSLNTYWQNTRTDWAQYFGKTPSAKAEQTIGPSLYNFIAFCRGSLPANGVRVAMVWPEQYGYLALQARYYLLPNQLGNDPAPNNGVNYILVYQRDNYSFPGFAVFKRLSNNEYILRKT